MRAHLSPNDIDYEFAKAKEKELRHDVMSHIHAFGEQCIQLLCGGRHHRLDGPRIPHVFHRLHVALFQIGGGLQSGGVQGKKVRNGKIGLL